MDSRSQNIELHIKNMEERCKMMQDKILNESNLTPDDIVQLRAKQSEYQLCLQWLMNIKADVFPPKILKLNNN